MSTDTKTAGSFDALLGELNEDLTKALPGAAADDDAEIAAAAKEGEGEGDEELDEYGKPIMAKSFKLTLEDGTEVDAVDGSDLIKSLTDRIETNETSVLGALKSAVTVIVAQGEMLKALQTKVGELGASGKGRKAVLAIAERPAAEAVQKADESQGMSGEEFMAKAISAQAVGAINGTQVAIAEAHINASKAPPSDIIAAVMAAASK